MPAKAEVSFVSPNPSGLSDEIDPIEAATLAIYHSRGWTRVDKHGRTVPDDSSAKTFVYEFFRDHVVVNADPDIVDDAMSAADLIAKAFPRAAGVAFGEIDNDQYAAYVAVRRKLWQWTQTSIRGYCQETAQMEGLDYVLCEKTVFRSARDGSTGSGEPRNVRVRFFTSDPTLIFELSSQPAASKLVAIAEETAKHLGMNTKRHPELTERVAKETRGALRRATGHLQEIMEAKDSTSGRSSAALTSGSGSDEQ